MRIYVVEDEVAIKKELVALLMRYGYEVVACDVFESVVDDVVARQPDLVLMDINLPYKDGYQLCKEIRERENIPIIMLTSQNSAMEEVMSLKAGADDFVAKPYHAQVLLAHIEAVYKRYSTSMRTDKIIYKGVSLNRLSGELKYQERTVDLTKNELHIMNLLMSKPKEIVSRDSIMEELWQDGEFVDENTLNVTMVRLRKKLSEMGLSDFVETKRGIGYKI